jgi:hypothetical protein
VDRHDRVPIRRRLLPVSQDLCICLACAAFGARSGGLLRIADHGMRSRDRRISGGRCVRLPCLVAKLRLRLLRTGGAAALGPAAAHR